LDEIIDSSLPDETPASKLKQLGMMAYIMEIVAKGEPITLTALVEASGLSRSAVGELMDKLVERGCLVESMGKNAWGRGKARQFSIGDAIIGALQR
jgi:DNA-binding IclR family transcriptional regulator